MSEHVEVGDRIRIPYRGHASTAEVLQVDETSVLVRLVPAKNGLIRLNRSDVLSILPSSTLRRAAQYHLHK